MTWRSEVEDQVRRKARVGQRFTIDDIYEMDEVMSAKYPNNRHVKATLRDVLQQLRDEGLIEQLGERGTDEAGNYKRIA